MHSRRAAGVQGAAVEVDVVNVSIRELFYVLAYTFLTKNHIIRGVKSCFKKMQVLYQPLDRLLTFLFGFTEMYRAAGKTQNSVANCTEAGGKLTNSKLVKINCPIPKIT